MGDIGQDNRSEDVRISFQNAIEEYLNRDIASNSLFLLFENQLQSIQSLQVQVTPDSVKIFPRLRDGTQQLIHSGQFCILPRIISFNELDQMLRNNQITGFSVEPYLQINLPSGYSMVRLTDRNGIRYMIQGRLDANTGMIYP